MYNTIQYIDTIFNTKCYVTYWYDLNKGLNIVRYAFQSNSYEDVDNIFSNLKKMLSKKYTIMADFYKNAPYDYVCFNERTVVNLGKEGKRVFISYYKKSHWYDIRKAEEEFKNKNKANITNADTSQF